MPKCDVGELITELNDAVNKLNNLRAKYGALEEENARLREAVKAAFAEGFSAGWEEGLEDGLVRPEGVYSRCDSKPEQSYWQDSHAHAALGEKE